MTAHAWEPVEGRGWRLSPDGPGLSPVVRTDVVCRRCEVQLPARFRAAVDRVPGWSDCDEMLVAGVMES